MRAWLKALTDFGDIAVLIPLAGLILLWLLAIRCPRCAAWWTIAIAFCVGLTALLKISFYDCPPMPDLHNPSGHTSLSTLVYGTVTLVTAIEYGAVRRIAAVGGGSAFVLGIAASRLILSFHSAPEVGLGLVLGTASLALFGQGYLRHRPARVWLAPLFVIGGAVAVALYRRHFPAEQLLHAIAGYLWIHCQ